MGCRVLETLTFTLDDMTLLAAPATGSVAVVDAAAGQALEALRRGEDERRVAATLARSRGSSDAAAAVELAELRQSWSRLAAPRRPARGVAPSKMAGVGRPVLDIVCRVGPTPVRLRVHPPHLARLIAAITAPCRLGFLKDAEAEAWPMLEVLRARGHYRLFLDSTCLLTTDDLMIARSETLRRLVLASHPDRRWLAVLHAAAVAGPAGAALLCGTSGAGKSTLTGFLLASGLAFVTDDYAPLEAGSWRLWPVPLGLSVKEGSWPLLAAAFPDLATATIVRTRQRRQRYVRPPRIASAPAPVACLVFPLYQPGTGVDLVALRPGEALALCAQSGGWFESSPERLEELTRWLARTPAYALSYGDTGGAVAAVRRLVGA
jgi:hypothetical protein